MKLYVGNLIHTMTESQLGDLFSLYGQVERALIITDHFTRQSKCFGYVKMFSIIDAERAVRRLHGKTVATRKLVVKHARPRDERLGNGW
jgi:RNA recognition motif-containing protein